MRSLTILTILSVLLGYVTSCKNGAKKDSDVIESSVNHDIHSSEIALDWDGIYYGTLPCADCNGISTQINLNSEGEYSKMTQYRGKDGGIFMEIGYFEWDDTGSIITLTSEEDDKSQYSVEENILKMLDLSGAEIEGDMADLYVLSKKYADFEGGKWRLVKLMGQEVEMTESGKNYPFIIFNPEDEMFSGSTGCNNFSGGYIIDKGLQIELSNIAITSKACMDMTIEKQFNAILNKVDNFSISSEKLTLNKAKMAPLAEFEPIYID